MRTCFNSRTSIGFWKLHTLEITQKKGRIFFKTHWRHLSPTRDVFSVYIYIPGRCGLGAAMASTPPSEWENITAKLLKSTTRQLSPFPVLRYYWCHLSHLPPSGPLIPVWWLCKATVLELMSSGCQICGCPFCWLSRLWAPNRMLHVRNFPHAKLILGVVLCILPSIARGNFVAWIVYCCR